MNNNQLVSPPQNNSIDRADIVIIGNGIAGLTAAVEARHRNPDKQIVIITDQTHPTINTPSLKQFAVGKLTREQLLAYPAGTEKAERIHVINSRVETIHARSKYVTLAGDSNFGYDSLLIATGATPQGLSEKIPGRNFDGVLTLHRLPDYLDLRRRINDTSEAIVVGGGVHAIETVMGLLPWGISVHWLIRGKTFMGKTLDEPASEIILENVRRAGVHVHIQTEITGIMGRVGAVAGIITNHQEMIPCQLILCCTGTSAAKELADSCSIPMKSKNGIYVDDKLRTSVRDIYAAGDVAALRNPQTGSFEPRALWYAAVAQGRIAGAMMVGQDELAREPFGVPWHGTHLGELSMLTVGDPMSSEQNVEVLTDNSQGGYRRMAIKDNRLIGYLALGAAQPDSLAIKRLIDDGYQVRDLIKPLLKGQLDPRAYLSQNRRVTQNLLAGPAQNRVPALPAPQQQQQMPMVAQQQMPMPQQQMPMVAQQQMSGRIPQQQPEKVAAAPQYVEDTFNPFTGKMPVVGTGDSRSQRNTRRLDYDDRDMQPRRNDDRYNYDDRDMRSRRNDNQYGNDDRDMRSRRNDDQYNYDDRDMRSRRNDDQYNYDDRDMRPRRSTDRLDYDDRDMRPRRNTDRLDYDDRDMRPRRNTDPLDYRQMETRPRQEMNERDRDQMQRPPSPTSSLRNFQSPGANRDRRNTSSTRPEETGGRGYPQPAQGRSLNDPTPFTGGIPRQTRRLSPEQGIDQKNTQRAEKDPRYKIWSYADERQ